MAFKDDKPHLEIVPMSMIDECAFIFERRKVEMAFVVGPTIDTKSFFVEENYQRYNWVLNLLDGSRWGQDS
jgi:hypothetical protein